MNLPKKVLLIVNPRSGKRKSRFGLFDIVQRLSARGMETTVIFTSKPKEAIFIVESKADAYECILCCGGDGTLNEVISGFMHTSLSLPIGYIPAGTTNDLAKTLRIPLNMDLATEDFLSGTPLYHDIGCLKAAGSTQDPMFFTYIASFGAFTKVSYDTPQSLKNRLGHLAYLLRGVKSVGEIRPYAVKVKADDVELEGDFVFGSVSNTTSIGGVVNLPSTKISLNDGLLEVLLIRNPQKPGDLSRVLYGLNNKKYDEQGIHFFHAHRVTFEFETEVAFTADGEFGGAFRQAEIECLSNRIQIIQKSRSVSEAISCSAQ